MLSYKNTPSQNFSGSPVPGKQKINDQNRISGRINAVKSEKNNKKSWELMHAYWSYLSESTTIFRKLSIRS
jgi:hypothetical protein